MYQAQVQTHLPMVLAWMKLGLENRNHISTISTIGVKMNHVRYLPQRGLVDSQITPIMGSLIASQMLQMSRITANWAAVMPTVSCAYREK